jgi:dipeptidyl aminopeptidase/acylaminoacyl peptidase
MKKVIVVFITVIVTGILYLAGKPNFTKTNMPLTKTPPTVSITEYPTEILSNDNSLPLSIKTMQQKSYPGSLLNIEKNLKPGSNYMKYLVSYLSDGFKIYGLLTVPSGNKPTDGWPIIIFNHGYIPPKEYSTENSYSSMIDPLASAGFIVFKPDYRGNGNSEGSPTQVYISPDYVTDSLNALSSIKRYPDANPNKIGVAGHSMGGNITLHEVVISHDIKAAAILSGVVGNYSDILDWWNKRIATGVLTTQNDQETARLVNKFVKDHGTPQTNPQFWNSIDPTNYISDISIPIQIQVGTNDKIVPPNFSFTLRDKLQSARKTVQLYSYPGADHNLTPDTALVISRLIMFFNDYLK